MAHVVGPSNITSKTSKIYTEDGYYNTQTEKSELFGRSVMKDEGKTMVGDSVFYDSKTGVSEAFNNVVYTDSLNYDRMYNVGYFFEGGKLVDNTSTLTSDWGEYHTDTHQALFNYDVRLKNKKFFLMSDTLYYNTDTHMAHVVGPSNITSKTSKRNTFKKIL